MAGIERKSISVEDLPYTSQPSVEEEAIRRVDGDDAEQKGAKENPSPAAQQSEVKPKRREKAPRTLAPKEKPPSRVYESSVLREPVSPDNWEQRHPHFHSRYDSAPRQEERGKDSLRGRLRTKGRRDARKLK